MNNLLPPTPPVNIAYEVASTINQTVQTGLASYAASVKEGFKLFWHHPKATPQEIADQFGTNCGAVFDGHAAAVQHLLALGVALNPEDYTPTLPFSRNPDGTVTVG